MTATEREFEIQGVHHLALVCKDMAKTVEFYRDVLGMPLVKTLDLPDGSSQHFFFDMGGGNSLAFFWFANAPEAAPGIAAPTALPSRGSFLSAHGSMNHIAFTVPNDKFEEYFERLKAKGIEVAGISNHDNSPTQNSPTVTDDVYVRSGRHLPGIRLLDPAARRLQARRRRARTAPRRWQQGRRDAAGPRITATGNRRGRLPTLPPPVLLDGPAPYRRAIRTSASRVRLPGRGLPNRARAVRGAAPCPMDCAAERR